MYSRVTSIINCYNNSTIVNLCDKKLDCQDILSVALGKKSLRSL